MKISKLAIVLLMFFLPARGLLWAGPYSPAAGNSGTTAVPMGSQHFSAWATGYTGLSYGSSVDSTYQTPDKALGPAVGNAADIVSLGRGGRITLTFTNPIRNGEGWDFAIFENSFSATFLELAYVEVSSNGTDFVRFDNDSLTAGSVGGYGNVDPTNVTGFAGKYQAGYGTPFDLSNLATSAAVINGLLDLSSITHVQIIDVIGDGTATDTDGSIIYDPYPTTGSAGFDLDAVGVRYENDGSNTQPPNQPTLSEPLNESIDVYLTPSLVMDPFSDPDVNDGHLASRWQIARDLSMDSKVLDVYSSVSLEKLEIPVQLLSPETQYYWRAAVYDNAVNLSDWSKTNRFTTAVETGSSSSFIRDWNNDGNVDVEIPTITITNAQGEAIDIGVEAAANINQIQAIDPASDATSDSNYRFPVGLVSLKLAVVDPQNPVQVRLYYSSAPEDGLSLYFYDPINEKYSRGAANTNADGTVMTFSVTDGTTQLDIDGVSNGTLLLRVGLGVFEPPATPSADGDGGVGEKGGCFISTVESRQGGLPVWLMLSLLILGALVMVGESVGAQKSTSRV